MHTAMQLCGNITKNKRLIMEPYVLPKLTNLEYKLILLCKGYNTDKYSSINIPPRCIFNKYPLFWYFYNTEYWVKESTKNMPYKPEEVEQLFVSLMTELLFKINPILLKLCILDTFGINTTNNSANNKRDISLLFKNLRSYIRLRVSSMDYRLEILEDTKN